MLAREQPRKKDEELGDTRDQRPGTLHVPLLFGGSISPLLACFPSTTNSVASVDQTGLAVESVTGRFELDL
jgi:hypothetical protein